MTRSGDDHNNSEWLLEHLMSANSFPYRPFFRTYPDEYVLFIDCPGIPTTALKVVLSGGHSIHIQGSHEACLEEHSTTATDGKHKRETRLCVERQIDRAYRIPDDVNLEGVESACKDGVLAIRFPRILETGREVPVKQVKSWF